MTPAEINEAKGLIFYDHAWRTAEEVDRLEAEKAAARQERIERREAQQAAVAKFLPKLPAHGKMPTSIFPQATIIRTAITTVTDHYHNRPIIYRPVYPIPVQEPV